MILVKIRIWQNMQISWNMQISRKKIGRANSVWIFIVGGALKIAKEHKINLRMTEIVCVGCFLKIIIWAAVDPWSEGELCEFYILRETRWRFCSWKWRWGLDSCESIKTVKMKDFFLKLKKEGIHKKVCFRTLS